MNQNMKKLNLRTVVLFLFVQVLSYGQVGVDNRTEANLSDPWMQGVGKLTGPGCTGTLIGGKYLLTAAHCNQPEGFCLHSTTDVSSCPANNYFKVSRRVYGVAGDSSTPVSSDWNVYELDRTATGAWVNTRTPYVGMRVTIVGYPQMLNSGIKPMVHRNCTVTSVYGGSITTDCDATPGNSGGPMLYCEYNSCDLVGVVVRAGTTQSNACAVSNFFTSLQNLSGVNLVNRSLGERAPTPHYTNNSNYYTHTPSYNNGGSNHYTPSYTPPPRPYSPPPAPAPNYGYGNSSDWRARYATEQERANDLLRRTEHLIRR